MPDCLPGPSTENILEGLFAFLDATLGPEIPRRFEKEGVEFNASDANSPIWRTRAWINSNFALQHPCCPLRAWLDPFGLYYAPDMADALATAYGLQRLGKDPYSAFLRDYTPHWAIITFAEDDHHEWAEGCWKRFGQFRRTGDRFVHYYTPPSSGYMLMRGSHRVMEQETVHACLDGIDEHWIEQKRRYDALGGVKSYLLGKFPWPLSP